MKINVLFMEPASVFINSLPEKAKRKFRTLFNGICYRLLAFWDTERNSIVVATHGFVKKTQKTPQKEIERAKALRAEYYGDRDDED